MKKILILGATGTLGNAVVSRLQKAEEYSMTLISRHATQVYENCGRIKVADCDATSVSELWDIMPGHDVVVCAIPGDELPKVAASLVLAMNLTHIDRLVFMGAVGIYNEIPDEMDGKDNVANNPEQIPNRDAVDIIENSGLNFTVLRPGYLCEGETDDYVLTFKGEQAKGYISTIPSVVNLIVSLIDDNMLYARQSVSITKDMSAHQ